MTRFNKDKQLVLNSRIRRGVKILILLKQTFAIRDKRLLY